MPRRDCYTFGAMFAEFDSEGCISNILEFCAPCLVGVATDMERMIQKMFVKKTFGQCCIVGALLHICSIVAYLGHCYI